VLNGGYLIRNATINSLSLYLQGDLNATATIEVIGAPLPISSLYFNGELVHTKSARAPVLSGELSYNVPTAELPNLEAQLEIYRQPPRTQLNV
jgi:hypothetical protein